ncbi:ubiquinol-cytochrome c reductase iron-sulfur subunit [Pricia sp.]|uniref:QcrA and Rieske domain-containing protein n=1 Tax=Pricia sp. TaxID=2268138 RepID=UPI003594633A
MERKQFLRSLGAGAAFAIAFPCLGACSKDDGGAGGNTPVPSGVDFTVDLESSEARKLAKNGGFILKNSVVVVQNLEGNFVAASQVCSHEGYAEVRFTDREGGIFFCDVHGSRFEQNGTPMNQVDSRPAKSLKIFKTELTGTVLRIFE